MQALLEPGDEMVCFEPAFDIYHAQVDMTGASVKTIPLVVSTNAKGSKVWSLNMDSVAAAFTSRTRIFLINTPHNPTGKVFSEEELSQLAAIVQKWPKVVCVADEVYEHLTYDGHKHISIATLPNMYNRSITCSSAGKTLSVTGWKIGWAVGPAHLVRCLAIVNQWVVFSVNSVSQIAIGNSLEFAQRPYKDCSSYFEWLNKDYCKKRDFLASALAKAGIEPVIPQGSFFIMGDTSKIQPSQKYLDDKTVTRDWAVCRWLTEEIGVAAIPPSSFYSSATKHMAANYARFAFCKPDDVLEEAAKRLLKITRLSRH